MGVWPRSRLSRETRLLLIVIGLSAAVLFALSRFRFPDQPGPAATAPTLPLERLAARATYDELATIIAELGRRVTPVVTVAQVDADGVPQFIPALRVRPDLLLAYVAPTSRVLSFVGSQEPIQVAAYDETRRLALFRVAPDASRVVDLRGTTAAARAPKYVAAIEGTRGGPALRPLFLGRADPVSDPRYADGLLVLGGVLQASAGSLIFGLDGSFVGLCILEPGFAAGIPGPALDAAINLMLRPS